MQQKSAQKRVFSASEVAEYEYCPLVWWHQKFEPLAQAFDDELFARLVSLEQEYGPQATTVPEYQVAEQILLKRGAFEAGPPPELEYQEEVGKISEEHAHTVGTSYSARSFYMAAILVFIFGLIAVAGALLVAQIAGFISTILLTTGVGLFLVAVAIVILIWNEKKYQKKRLEEEHKSELKLPPGELVYEDAEDTGEPLYSGEYPLIGKPDFVVQGDGGQLIPIEQKYNVQGETAPMSNHAVQMAAYCLILEDYTEAPVTHGIVRYADRDLSVEYTTALRKKVIKLLNEMMLCSETQPPALAKQKVSKCRACVFQPICPVGRGK